MENAAKKLIVALDDLDYKSALNVVSLLRPYASTFKIGLSLFTAHGPQIVREVRDLGVDVFLDLKLFDIPMQVAKAVESALQFSPRFLTVHAMGGKKMLNEAHAMTLGSKTKLLAVSVLTSFDQADYHDVGFNGPIDQGVLRLSDLAFSTGIKAFVSSPHELSVLRSRYGSECFLVCPGVRPHNGEIHDQSRVMTPADAILLSADALVVGRPITKAGNMLKAALMIHEEIASALSIEPAETMAGASL
jgi:orotidine-5'-phosphate decarboxylase